MGEVSGTVLEGALGDIDLVNPDNYVERVPFDWFDRLREDYPVVWHPEPKPNKGFWAVTRYDDLTSIHMDWESVLVRDRRRFAGGAGRRAARGAPIDARDRSRGTRSCARSARNDSAPAASASTKTGSAMWRGRAR